MEQRIIVSGILEHNDKILLAKRPLTKKIAPGKYHLPGGHVEFGEDPVQALVREFEEEFKLKINVGNIVRAFSYTIENIHTIGITYEVTSTQQLSTIKTDPVDTSEISWVSSNNLGQYLQETDNDFITIKEFFRSQ